MHTADRLGRLAAPAGRAGIRGAVIGLLVAMVAGLAIGSGLATGGVGSGAAWAAGDPPDVRGLTPAAAKQALLAWNRAVVVAFSPELANLPAGTDPSNVVAARSTLISSPQVAASAPRVLVSLGTLVPDLTGDTLAAATERLTRHGLPVSTRPVDAASDWLVSGQDVLPATLVELGAPVGVLLVAPTVATPSPGPVPATGGLTRPVAVVAASSAAVLVLLALLGTLALRRSRRRRPSAPAERVEVRAHPGQVVGPDLVELAPGPGRPGTVGVRLEPRYDPGTFLIEEGHR